MSRLRYPDWWVSKPGYPSTLSVGRPPQHATELFARQHHPTLQPKPLPAASVQYSPRSISTEPAILPAATHAPAPSRAVAPPLSSGCTRLSSDPLPEGVGLYNKVLQVLLRVQNDAGAHE
eukprot:scaffold60040_cov63-Phaeocystis_antarctica.AAC.1